MKTEKGYRYTISFNDDSEENIRAGRFLELCGHRKGTILVSALNDYLDGHPELEAAPMNSEIKVKQTITREQVEGIVRTILSDYHFTPQENAQGANPESDAAGIDEAYVDKMVDKFDKFFG